MTLKQKRLVRSESDRMLAGVCGGIAEYFGWDSTLVRLVFIMIILLGGSGVLVYIALWFILPTESKEVESMEKRVATAAEEIQEAAKSVKPKLNAGDRSVGGIFLIGLGILFLLQNFGVGRYLQFDKTWPVLLVILGFVMLRK